MVDKVAIKAARKRTRARGVSHPIRLWRKMKLAEKMKEVGRHRLYPVMVARYSDSGSASDLSATRLLIVFWERLRTLFVFAIGASK